MSGNAPTYFILADLVTLSVVRDKHNFYASRVRLMYVWFIKLPTNYNETSYMVYDCV